MQIALNVPNVPNVPNVQIGRKEADQDPLEQIGKIERIGTVAGGRGIVTVIGKEIVVGVVPMAVVQGKEVEVGVVVVVMLEEAVVVKGKGVAPSLRNGMKDIEKTGVVQEARMTSQGFPEEGRRPYGGTDHQLVSSI